MTLHLISVIISSFVLPSFGDSKSLTPDQGQGSAMLVSRYQVVRLCQVPRSCVTHSATRKPLVRRNYCRPPILLPDS